MDGLVLVPHPGPSMPADPAHLNIATSTREYKDAKEAFVAGHGGTSVAEVQLVVSVALVRPHKPASRRGP